MDELGPLSMMYSWQSLLCATAAVSMTTLLKRILDASMGDKKRKSNKWITQVLLPSIPVLIGALYAMLIPLRPEALMAYADLHLDSWYWELLGYGGWGAACGQFSSFLHGKTKDFLEAGKSQGSSD